MNTSVMPKTGFVPLSPSPPTRNANHARTAAIVIGHTHRERMKKISTAAISIVDTTLLRLSAVNIAIWEIPFFQKGVTHYTSQQKQPPGFASGSRRDSNQRGRTQSLNADPGASHCSP